MFIKTRDIQEVEFEKFSLCENLILIFSPNQTLRVGQIGPPWGYPTPWVFYIIITQVAWHEISSKAAKIQLV